MTSRDELADKQLQQEAQQPDPQDLLIANDLPRPTPPVGGSSPVQLPGTPPQQTIPDRIVPTPQESDYANAEIALYTHLGRGNDLITPQAVRPIAKLYVDKFYAEEPSLLRALENDVNALMAMTDDDIATRIAQGEKILPESGDIMDIVADIAYEAALGDLYENFVASKQDATRKGWNQLVGPEVEQLRAIVDQEARRLAMDSDDPNAQLFADQIEGDVTWAITNVFDAPTIWTWDGGEGLVFEVTGGEGIQTLGVRLDPGTEITDSSDALKELILARSGLAHEFTSEQDVANQPGFVSKAMKAVAEAAENSPIARSTADKAINLWNIANTPNLIDATDEDIIALWNEKPFSSRSVRNDEGRALRAQELAGDPNVIKRIDQRARDLLTIAIAEAAWELEMEQMPPELNPENLKTAGLEFGDLLDAIEEVLTTNPEVQDLLTEQSSDEVIEEALSQLEDQTVIGEGIENAVGFLFEGLSKWDNVTQGIAVNVIDFLVDLAATSGVINPQEILDSFQGDTPLSEGQQIFLNMFEETNPFQSPEADDVADYFSLEGAGADAALFTAGVVFDPLNFVFGGPKFAAQLSRKMLMNPKYAPLYVKTYGRRLTSSLLNRTGDDGLRVVASISGHTPDSLRDFAEIALTDPKDLTRKQVEEVIMKHLPSTEGAGFITLGSADRARTHLFANMLGDLIDRVPTMNDDLAAEVWQSVAKLDKTRTMNLQPTVFIDEFLDTVVTIKPGDKEFLAGWTARLANTIEDATIGREQLQASAQARLEFVQQQTRKLEDELEALAGVDNVGGSITSLSQELDSITDTLAQARREGRAGAVDALTRQKRALTAAKRAELDRKREILGELKKFRASTEAAKRELMYAQAAGTNEAQARLVAELYDEVAQTIPRIDDNGDVVIGLEVIGNDDTFGDLAKYDWSPVQDASGKGRQRGIREAATREVSPTEGLVGEGSDLAADLDELGLFNKQAVTQTPVSPYELVVYERLMRGKTGRPDQKALAAWRDSRVRNWLSSFYGGYRKLFAVNLLINLTTPIVTNADEVARFWAVSGRHGRTIRALAAPFPGTARGLDAAGVEQYTRDVLGDLVSSHTTWEWVKRPLRGRGTQQGKYVDQVERFVNGQILQDDILRQWAQAKKRGSFSYISGAGDDIDYVGQLKARGAPDEFKDWWENGIEGGAPGSANYRNSRVNKNGRTEPMTVDEVFQRVDAGIRRFVKEMVDPEKQNEFTEKLIDLLVEGGRFDRELDAVLLKSVKQVPGMNPVRGGVTDRVFDTFYGKPGQRRGALFYDHFYDEQYKLLRDVYREKGTLLDPETLMAQLGKQGIVIDGQDAAEILARGFDDPRLATLARGGFVTDETLKVQAARYAERRADELMYNLASTSLWGEAGEAAFPFLRAQTDFLGWWWKHMTSPAPLRLGPEARSIPGISQLVRGIESIPLNVRTAAKFSHIAATVNNNFNSESPGGFDWATDTFTFFPLKNSGDIMMDVMPTPLGAPSWMTLWAIDNAEEIPDTWRTLAEDIWPALQWSTTGNWSNVEMLFPASERSLRNAAGTLVRFGSAIAAANNEDDIDPNATVMGDIAAFLTTQRQPTGTTTAQAIEFLKFLRSPEAGRLRPTRDNEEWLKQALSAAESGAVTATRRSAWELLKGQVKLSERYGGDAPQLDAYSSIIDNYAMVEPFLPKNLTIDEGGQPRLLRIWELWQAGEASEEDVNFLADSMATLVGQTLKETSFTQRLPNYSVREYLMTRDRGLALNAVSKLQVTPGLALQGGKAAEFAELYEGPDGRVVNIPPGQEGLEIRSEALDKGWVMTRPSVEWMEDVHSFSDSAARNTLRAAWQLVSGKEWGREATLRVSSNGVTYDPGLPIEDSDGNPRRNLVVTPDDLSRHLLDIAGVDLEDKPYTLQDLRIIINERMQELAPSPFAYSQLFTSSEMARQINSQGGPEGQQMLMQMRMASNALELAGFDEPDEMPEPAKEWFRQRFIGARDLGWLSDKIYRNSGGRIFGDLNWEPPTPPPESELTSGFRVDPAEVDVSDGDTLVIPMADGDLRVRLLGINAPEAGSGPEAIKATESLLRAVNRADTITLGFYQPEIFGVAQTSAPGVQRLVAWLYINGVPVYDENAFTAVNQTGAALGGNFVDIWELYGRRANG